MSAHTAGYTRVDTTYGIVGACRLVFALESFRVESRLYRCRRDPSCQKTYKQPAGRSLHEKSHGPKGTLVWIAYMILLLEALVAEKTYSSLFTLKSEMPSCTSFENPGVVAVANCPGCATCASCVLVLQAVQVLFLVDEVVQCLILPDQLCDF